MLAEVLSTVLVSQMDNVMIPLTKRFKICGNVDGEISVTGNLDREHKSAHLTIGLKAGNL